MRIGRIFHVPAIVVGAVKNKVPKLDFRRLTIMLSAFVALAISGAATAGVLSSQKPDAPAVAEWQGWCGGPAKTVNMLLHRWASKGVSDDAARRFHVSPVNDSLSNWAHRDVGLAVVAKKTGQLGNKGCSHASFFDAQSKILKPGDRAFVNTAPLRAMFPDGFSLTPHVGWKKKMVCLMAVANPTCSNPLNGLVCVWVWVPQQAAPPPSGQRAPVTIVKIAEDSFNHVIPTPTNTFFFTVTTTGGVTTVRYDQDPQSAGTCIVGEIVLVAENPTPGWELFSPLSNLQTFVCQKGKGVTAVFKNRQQRPGAPPPTTPTTTQPPPTSTSTTTTTTTTSTSTTTTTTPQPVTYNVSCSGSRTVNKSNLELQFSASGSASNGAVPVNAFWTFSDGSTGSGLSITRTFGLYDTTYSGSATVLFSDGHSKGGAACSAQTGPPPPPPPGGRSVLSVH